VCRESEGDELGSSPAGGDGGSPSRSIFRVCGRFSLFFSTFLFEVLKQKICFSIISSTLFFVLAGKFRKRDLLWDRIRGQEGTLFNAGLDGHY
jgi:hypothetical protein